MRVNTKTLLTIASVSLLFVACGLAPNKEEQNLTEILTTRLDSLTKVIENDQKTNVSEEVLLMQKVLEWRLDSIEKTQKFNDSLNAYYKAKEEIIRDSIRILQREKDSLEAIKNARQAPVLVKDGMSDTIQNIQYKEQLSLTQAIAQKDLLIAQQNEKIRLDSLEIDSMKRLNQKEINKSNPEVKAMQDNVITQLNYCILTSYYIKHSPSLDFFLNKKDEMINHLNVESIKGIEEIQQYRTEIHETLNGLTLNEYEKQIYNDVLDIEKKNRKLNAAKNALQVPQLSVNPFSAIANTVLTIARAGIDLAVSKNEIEMQNIRSMWEFRREQLNWVHNLEENGFYYLYKLFEKYNLKEYHRLTENDIERYFSALSEPNPDTRSRRLEDDSLVFKNMHDYYYYLGMAYIEADSTEVGYKRAEPYFDRYIKQYNKYPLFTKDEKTGIIALTRLLHGSKETSKEYKITLIEEIEKNLPQNEMGYSVGCMEYYAMGEKEKAFNLLRKGIDAIDDNDAALINIALKYMNEIQKYPEIYRKVCGAILGSKSLSLQEYAACVIAMDNNSRNERLKELLILTPNGELSFYVNKKLLKNTNYTESLNKTFIEKDVQLYYESITNIDTFIYECNVRPFWVSEDELYSNAELLNKNRETNIKTYFFEESSANGKSTYYIRTPFGKTEFNKNSDTYRTIMGKSNVIDYSDAQNDSLYKILVKYCERLSTYRENLLFSNNYIVKIDSITNLISICDKNLRILCDSTKILEDKAALFKQQADSLASLETDFFTQIEITKKNINELNNNIERLELKHSAQTTPIKKQINDLESTNDTLDVPIKDYDSATKLEKGVAWLKRKLKDSQEYDRNKKEINQLQSTLNIEEQNYRAEYNRLVKNKDQLQSSLNTEEQKQKSIHDEYEDAVVNYNRINTEHGEINTNIIEEQKEQLENELENLCVKKDNIYFYGNRPVASKLVQYNDTCLIAPQKENELIAKLKEETELDVLSVEVVKVDSSKNPPVILKIYYGYKFQHNQENGDYLKVILGEDNGSFEKVVLTYKKDGDKWVFYASEMIDGSKYRLAQ